jgi:hypothetical protein
VHLHFLGAHVQDLLWVFSKKQKNATINQVNSTGIYIVLAITQDHSYDMCGGIQCGRHGFARSRKLGQSNRLSNLQLSISLL